MKPEFQLVLPCYNESKSITAIVERASSAAKAAGMGPEKFQLVLVENGSKDNSLAVMKEVKNGPLGAWFQIVEVKVNQGYGFGLWQGLNATTAETIAWSHADEQTDPADAFKAFEMLNNSSSPSKTIIKGKRLGRDPKDAFVSKVFEMIALLILNKCITEINAQPKVFKRALLEKLSSPPWNFAFDIYVLYTAVKNGYEIKNFPVKFPQRKHGTSNWAFSFWSRHKTILGMIKYMWTLRWSRR